MSNFSIIRNVSLELRRQVHDALVATPDTDFGLTGPDDIALDPPGDRISDTAQASLYLYHVEIDRHLRNQLPLPDRDRADAFRQPPLTLRLRYLFTPVSNEEESNHLILGRVLQHVYDNPYVRQAAGSPIGESFGGASARLRVVPDMLTVEQLAQLWNALSEPYRNAVAFLVDIAAIDSARPPEQRTRVTALISAAGKSREPS